MYTHNSMETVKCKIHSLLLQKWVYGSNYWRHDSLIVSVEAYSLPENHYSP